MVASRSRNTGDSWMIASFVMVTAPLMVGSHCGPLPKSPFQNEGARPLILPQVRTRFGHSETGSKDTLKNPGKHPRTPMNAALENGVFQSFLINRVRIRGIGAGRGTGNRVYGAHCQAARRAGNTGQHRVTIRSRGKRETSKGMRPIGRQARDRLGLASYREFQAGTRCKSPAYLNID